MQHTKVSYELIQNYISSPRVTEKDSHDPASAIENRLMREIVRGKFDETAEMLYNNVLYKGHECRR